MGTWVDEYMQMVDDCEKREARLTEWEVGFIDSIRNRLEKEIPLTPRQADTLDNVWERATSNG